VKWARACNSARCLTKLVAYSERGHMFIKPGDTRDYSLRSLEWFEEWFAKAP